MVKNQKFIRSAITIILSVLFSVLVVFSVASGVSYIRQDALKVEGNAIIENDATIKGFLYTNKAAVINNVTDSNTQNGLLVLAGKIGLGPKFATTNPTYRLDVDGIVNANGFLKAGQPIVYKANCLGPEKYRSSNNEVIDQWCGASNPALNDGCVPFLVSFNQNDNDPDAIRNIACRIENNRLFIHTDTTGGDSDRIGEGSVCGAICAGYVDVSGSTPQSFGSGPDCSASNPNVEQPVCY